MSNQYFIKYAEILKSEDIYHSPKSLIWYYKNTLFRDMEMDNKTFLDIGGGHGLLSFCAAADGASRVDLLEPLDAGSGTVSLKKFEILKNKLTPFSDWLFRSNHATCFGAKYATFHG